MKTIYKYPLAVNDVVAVQLPVGAEVLTVQIQNDVPCIWVRLDPEKPVETRHFCWRGTRQDAVDCGRYIGTVQLRYGQLVFHLFEGSDTEPSATPKTGGTTGGTR